jgi:hypothetical protein
MDREPKADKLCKKIDRTAAEGKKEGVRIGLGERVGS